MSKSILIVEDDVSLCLSLSDFLNEMGFDTAVAGDGLKALEILDRYGKPDYILLDLHMPNMDGWQFRELLKKHSEYCGIRVIIMSGDSMCRSVEADAHLMKPFDLSSVLDAIKVVQ